MRIVTTLGLLSVMAPLLLKPTLGVADEIAELKNRILALERRLEAVEFLIPHKRTGHLCESKEGSFPYKVSKEEIEQLKTNIPMLLTLIHAVPYFIQGKAAGLRLFAIRPGSFFDCIGLLNGDVVTKVGDKSPGDLVEFVSLLMKDEPADQPEVALSIIRSGMLDSLIIRKENTASPAL